MLVGLQGLCLVLVSPQSDLAGGRAVSHGGVWAKGQEVADQPFGRDKACISIYLRLKEPDLQLDLWHFPPPLEPNPSPDLRKVIDISHLASGAPYDPRGPFVLRGP